MEGGCHTKLRKTSEKVTIKNKKYAVYVGCRGGKYIRYKGKKTLLSKVMRN